MGFSIIRGYAKAVSVANFLGDKNKLNCHLLLL
jgi:hypothetical protein